VVVYFDSITKDIVRTEENTQVPIMPFNMTLAEQKVFYKSINQDFIIIKEEMGADILNYNLLFNTNDNFTGLEPK